MGEDAGWKRLGCLIRSERRAGAAQHLEPPAAAGGAVAGPREPRRSVGEAGANLPAAAFQSHLAPAGLRSRCGGATSGGRRRGGPESGSAHQMWHFERGSRSSFPVCHGSKDASGPRASRTLHPVVGGPHGSASSAKVLRKKAPQISRNSPRQREGSNRRPEPSGNGEVSNSAHLLTWT